MSDCKDDKEDNHDKGSASNIAKVGMGTELLIDGSFESAIVGNNTWSHQAVVGGWHSDTQIETWGKGFYGLKASDGNKIAELDYDNRDSNIYQTVHTESGAEYTFSFDYMKRPDSKAGSDTIQVFWNNKLVGTVDPTKSEWAKAEFKVVGTGSDDRIEFREASGDNDSYGGLIDNASMKKSGLSTDEKAASEKRNNDDDKHDGRDHGDGDHNDDGHDDNGQGSVKADKAKKEAEEKAAAEKAAAEQAAAEKAAAEKAAAEQAAAEKAAAEKAAAEKAAAEQAAAEKAAAEQAAAEKAAADAAHHAEDALALKAADVAKGYTSDVLHGKGDDDALNGGVGNDQLFGNDGNDVLSGDTGGRVTAPLDIKVDLVDADNSETLSLMLSGMPKGSMLSAGTDNGDGTWTLSADDLDGLMITADDRTNFQLHVVATANDSWGGTLTESADISVVLDTGNQDLLVGGKGNDNLTGGAGDDVMYGGSIPTGANPHVATFADADVVHGNDGNDVIYGNSGDDQVFGDAGNDFVSGGKGNDLVSGGDGSDVIKGNSGDDVITADAGDDQITGGSGFDTLDYSMSKVGLAVDMAAHTATGMGNDTIDGIEKVIGSSFDDVLVGNSHDNVFVGGAGDDRMSGGKGNDTLSGGDGNDTFAFAKSDVFNVKAQTGWVDHVTDFQVGDKLELTGFFKAGTTNIASLVSVTDGADGSTLSVKFAGEFHAVAVLDGVHGLTANDMMKDGMLFVA